MVCVFLSYFALCFHRSNNEAGKRGQKKIKWKRRKIPLALMLISQFCLLHFCCLAILFYMYVRLSWSVRKIRRRKERARDKNGDAMFSTVLHNIVIVCVHEAPININFIPFLVCFSIFFATSFFGVTTIRQLIKTRFNL